MTNPFDFTGKRILVFGLGGIGSATARRLDAQGAEIAVIGRNTVAMDSLMESLAGNLHDSYIYDFSDLDGIEALINEITADKKPDAVVFCIGTADVRPLKMSNVSFMRKVMDVNFLSFIEIVRCLTLKKNLNPGGLNIVGISALGAFQGNSTKTAYCASKAAMNAAVRCIAKELHGKNVRINTVAPAVTDTPMNQKALEYGADSPEFRATLQRQYMGICQPDDIVDSVMFLLSDASKMITGSCISVDGGKLTS